MEKWRYEIIECPYCKGKILLTITWDDDDSWVSNVEKEVRR